MVNELMARLFGGASLALLVVAGLSTSPRALADPPNGWATCAATCEFAQCSLHKPCTGECGSCNCECLPWDPEDKCSCGI
jgi:hypothetical protein